MLRLSFYKARSENISHWNAIEKESGESRHHKVKVWNCWPKFNVFVISCSHLLYISSIVCLFFVLSFVWIRLIKCFLCWVYYKAWVQVQVFLRKNGKHEVLHEHDPFTAHLQQYSIVHKNDINREKSVCNIVICRFLIGFDPYFAICLW